jgi:hypothetical protein
MKRKITSLTVETDILVDLTFHKISASLLSDFVEQIVKPYYGGNLNAAFQDLIQKALAEQEFMLAHVTHIRPPIQA